MWRRGQAGRVEEGGAPCGGFVVRGAFTLIGRGTCVVGYIASGDVDVGDVIRWTNDDVALHARCRGVEDVRESPLKDPPSVGLLVDEGEPEHFAEGMTLLAYR